MLYLFLKLDKHLVVFLSELKDHLTLHIFLVFILIFIDEVLCLLLSFLCTSGNFDWNALTFFEFAHNLNWNIRLIDILTFNIYILGRLKLFFSFTRIWCFLLLRFLVMIAFVNLCFFFCWYNFTRLTIEIFIMIL